jgi:GNAT superfamily N-acetyltransferase
LEGGNEKSSYSDTFDTNIRSLRKQDTAVISDAFTAIGWNKPVEQYEAYLDQQTIGDRAVLVATVDDEFSGYITVNWQPPYLPFRTARIPEIQDLNVLPHFRKRGVASSLIRRAEEIVSERSKVIGIGVGMHPDYGNAQRLYVQLGYIPDGRGLTYKYQVLQPMDRVVNDDDLVLFFTKRLRD